MRPGRAALTALLVSVVAGLIHPTASLPVSLMLRAGNGAPPSAGTRKHDASLGARLLRGDPGLVEPVAADGPAAPAVARGGPGAMRRPRRQDLATTPPVSTANPDVDPDDDGSGSSGSGADDADDADPCPSFESRGAFDCGGMVEGAIATPSAECELAEAARVAAGSVSVWRHREPPPYSIITSLPPLSPHLLPLPFPSFLCSQRPHPSHARPFLPFVSLVS